MDNGIARVARVVCWAAGVATLAWAVRSPMFRGSDGALQGTVCLPVAVGFSVLLAGTGLGTRYQQFLCWVAVAVVGQAMTLQMIDAGRRVHYQHYEPIGVIWRTRPWLLVWIAGQSALVGAALAHRARAHHASFGIAFSAWQLAGMAILSLSTAATVSPSVSRYLAELGFAAYLQLLGVATIVLVATAFPAARIDDVRALVERWLGTPNEPATRTPRPDRFAWSCAFLVTFAAAALSVFSYQRHPHVLDEVVYLLHAGYLASGMLTMPAPPVPAAFDMELMQIEAGRWFCPVPPGWPAALAVGAAAGAPWLVNPILGGVNVILAFTVLQRLYDRRTARLGALLLALSPWHLFLAMSFMTQTLTLTLALLATVGVIECRRTGKARWALLGGGAIGGVALARPLDGAIVGAGLAVWAAGVGGPRVTWPSLAALLAGSVAVGGLMLPYNAHLTGDPLRFPISVYTDQTYGRNSNAYGFGPDRGMGWAFDPNPGHSPLDGAINANLNTFSINTDLFGWSTGSLIFIALLLCSRSLGPGDRLSIAAAALVFVAYFFYYFSGGPDFGARYWILMIVPLVALTARGIERLVASPAGARASVAVLALCGMAAVNYVPWRAIDKYYRYRGMRPDVRELAGRHTFDGALVLIRGNQFPDYASAAVLNPVDLNGRAPVFAWDRDAAARAATLRAYSNRPVWILEGPTVTKSGYRIVEGPLPAATVLAQTWSTP